MLNVFNIGIVLILIGYIIGGWKNGVVKETANFIGMIIVFFVSYLLMGIVGDFLCTICPFFKLDGLISLNILIYHGIAFIVLFSILMSLFKLVLKFSNALQKIINATIILIIPSKIVGAIISFVEGWITIFIVLLVLLVPFRNVDQFKNSTLSNVVLFKTPVLSKTVKPFTKGVVEIYDISNKISKKEITTNEANLKSIKIMLKYKLVNKKEIRKLVEQGKLSEIKDIESIIKA